MRVKVQGCDFRWWNPQPHMSRLQTAAAMDVLPANQTIVKGMRGVAIDIQWVPGAEVAMEAMTHMVIFYRKLLNYQRVSLLTGPHCVDFRFLVCWVICCHAKLGGFHKPICGPTHFVELFFCLQSTIIGKWFSESTKLVGIAGKETIPELCDCAGDASCWLTVFTWLCRRERKSHGHPHFPSKTWKLRSYNQSFPTKWYWFPQLIWEEGAPKIVPQIQWFIFMFPTNLGILPPPFRFTRPACSEAVVTGPPPMEVAGYRPASPRCMVMARAETQRAEEHHAVMTIKQRWEWQVMQFQPGGTRGIFWVFILIC